MSQKKIISLTIPPDLADRVDQKVEETGAKSRSSFIASLIEQSLSGRTFSLTEEEHEALLFYSKTVGKSPEEVVRFVLTKVVGAGEKVRERFENAIPVIPTD